MDMKHNNLVLIEARTYLRAVYLLLASAVGMFYLIFVAAGLSLGLGWTMLWVGLPILLMGVAGWWGLGALERKLALWLRHADISPVSDEARPAQRAWAWTSEQNEFQPF
jgi:hypothetical protein